MAVTADLVAGNPVSEKDCVLHLQAQNFRIETQGELQSDLDGEIGQSLPLTIETVPQAIAIYC
jgi:diacylglycerol kinase family enzyme